MARILGAVASSHTPTIGFALDTHKQDDPAWAPIFAGYKPVQEWLAARRPDVLLIVFNDHVTSFFFDHYSQFALGIGESYARPTRAAGRGRCRQSAGTQRSPITLLRVLSPTSSTFPTSRTSRSITAASRRCQCCGRTNLTGLARSCRCRSVCSNSRFPRHGDCFSLGQCLRKAIESYPEDLNVLVATGASSPGGSSS